MDAAIAMQEGAGLEVVSDGELRRHTFIDQLLEAVDGLTPDPDSDHIPVPFRDETGDVQSVFKVPVSVTDKLRRSLSVTDELRRRRMMTTEEYAYARAVARRPIKVTLPSPRMLFLAWSPNQPSTSSVSDSDAHTNGHRDPPPRQRRAGARPIVGCHGDSSSRIQGRCVRCMSIEAVISRIDVIAQAQQQLASPIGSSASAGSIGALLGGTQA
ncbi:MAG: hypothetical protein ACXVSE_17040, partial [Solirubrobacteraceae bacterium]